MADAIFTPGPWSLESEDNGYAEVLLKHADTEAIQISGGDWTVAVALDDGPPGKANAHLIAAAPELYSNLDMLTTILENISLPGFSNQPEMVKAMRVCLAKARGES